MSEEKSVEIARLSYRQAVVVAIIAALSGIMVALITSGSLRRRQDNLAELELQRVIATPPYVLSWHRHSRMPIDDCLSLGADALGRAGVDNVRGIGDTAMTGEMGSVAAGVLCDNVEMIWTASLDRSAATDLRNKLRDDFLASAKNRP